MSRIDVEEVKRLADAARIAVTDEQANKYVEQINDILALTKQLEEVDTTDVKPTVHVIDNMTNVMREDDTPQEGLAIEDIVRNAPDHQDGQIRVPSILE